MFSGMLLKIEQGLTNELLVKMQKLQRDVDDLADRTDEELERLGLSK